MTSFVILTLTDLWIVKKCYSKESLCKTQFRGMTEFISENSSYVYAIVEEKTPWQHALEKAWRCLKHAKPLVPNSK